MGIGEKIAHILKVRGITQREFAKMIGLQEATLSRYINGTRTPNIQQIREICMALDVSADWLIGVK